MPQINERAFFFKGGKGSGTLAQQDEGAHNSYTGHFWKLSSNIIQLKGCVITGLGSLWPQEQVHTIEGPPVEPSSVEVL